VKQRFFRERRTTLADLSETHAPLSMTELRLVAGGGARLGGGPLLGGGLGGIDMSPRTRICTLASADPTTIDVQDD
jgi:hypothetical protein